MNSEVPEQGAVAGGLSITALQTADREVGASPRRETLTEVFAQAAARWPGHVALETPDAVYTYAELAEAAARVAQRLRMHGVGPGDRVAVRLSSGRSELHLAILGVLQSGAAYVPIDADDPADRAADIVARSGACATVTDGLGVELSGPTPAGADCELTADDDAWIIFTSGTTGAPKGVAVTHRSAAAFVDAEAQLWEVTPEDRVLAGLSVGFDASCEEMWLAWAHGAALLPAPRAVVRAGVELGNWLVDNRITVVSTVPTLAALWDESCLHRVRLLILGGEACPEKLGWRLAAGREVWNTYGPTEATVVTTAAPIVPGEPITIGSPLDGWEVEVLDGETPVALGGTGELVIGGIGLARYLDPQLDAARYAGVEALGWRRAYRTGDLVRLTPDGLQFVGRRDDQIKIGGRRIELGEVEAVLQSATGVQAAAVAVRESSSGNRLLVGYVVGRVDCEAVRRHAAAQLPAGIVPLVVALPELPLTGSGKVDRRSLPWPVGDDGDALAAGIGADGTILSDHEVWVGEQWTAQLGPVPIGPHSDFFALGGTSLAAAKLTSSVRRRYPALAVADLYRNPTLRTFAARLEGIGAGEEMSVTAGASARTGARLVQLACLLSLVVVDVPSWLGAVLAFDRWYHVGPQLAWGWIVAGWFLLSNVGTHAVLAGVARRVLLSGVRPGRYPRNGWTSFRVLFVERLADRCRLDGLCGTPWAARYARLSGHDVGAGARLGTLPPASSLTRIAAGATLEGDVDLHGWWIEGAEMVIGEVLIGEDARVGTRVLLMPGAIVEAGAEIEPGAVINGRVPAGERWAGSPARCVGRAGDSWPADPPADHPHTHVGHWRRMYALGLVIQMLVPLLAAVPGILVLLLATGGTVDSTGALMLTMLVLAPALALLYTVSLALLIAFAVRLLGRWIEPGWHAGAGRTPWALWLTDRLLAESRAALFPLYASSFTNRWLSLCAIPVGTGSEVSTAAGINRLTAIGATSFLADDVAFAGARSRGGWLHVSPLTVGDRVFLGNGAILPAGSSVGDESLIGLMTVSPRSCPRGTSWLGAPALELPRRRAIVDPSRTVNPARSLRMGRRLMDVIRILFPTSAAVVLGALAYGAAQSLGSRYGFAMMALSLPFVLIGMGVCAVLITIAVKWLLMGRYQPGEHPFYSFYVWRDEIVNTCQEQLAGAMLMTLALGSALMPPYLRLLGAKVGRDVWVDTLTTTEFDLASFGDGCAVNRGAVVETHLFHDRLMSTGPVHIGAGATLGPYSVSLPDTVIGDGTVVGGRAIVMRGEELPPGSRWHGAPVTAE